MNERIEELAKQATETVRCGLNGSSTAEYFDRKKFAELIVKECANIAYKTYWDNVETVRGIQIKEKIKSSFGIE
jgi:hypothetical protein